MLTPENKEFISKNCKNIFKSTQEKNANGIIKFMQELIDYCSKNKLDSNEVDTYGYEVLKASEKKINPLAK